MPTGSSAAWLRNDFMLQQLRSVWGRIIAVPHRPRTVHIKKRTALDAIVGQAATPQPSPLPAMTGRGKLRASALLRLTLGDPSTTTPQNAGPGPALVGDREGADSPSHGRQAIIAHHTRAAPPSPLHRQRREIPHHQIRRRIGIFGRRPRAVDPDCAHPRDLPGRHVPPVR